MTLDVSIQHGRIDNIYLAVIETGRLDLSASAVKLALDRKVGRVPTPLTVEYYSTSLKLAVGSDL